MEDTKAMEETQLSNDTSIWQLLPPLPDNYFADKQDGLKPASQDQTASMYAKFRKLGGGEDDGGGMKLAAEVGFKFSF